MKEVFSANNSIDWCTLPEYTNESVVKANHVPRTGALSNGSLSWEPPRSFEHSFCFF